MERGAGGLGLLFAFVHLAQNAIDKIVNLHQVNFSIPIAIFAEIVYNSEA